MPDYDPLGVPLFGEDLLGGLGPDEVVLPPQQRFNTNLWGEPMYGEEEPPIDGNTRVCSMRRILSVRRTDAMGRVLPAHRVLLAGGPGECG